MNSLASECDSRGAGFGNLTMQIFVLAGEVCLDSNDRTAALIDGFELWPVVGKGVYLNVDRPCTLLERGLGEVVSV